MLRYAVTILVSTAAGVGVAYTFHNLLAGIVGSAIILSIMLIEWRKG